MFDRASHGKDAAGNLPYGQHEPPSFDLFGTGEPEAVSGGITCGNYISTFPEMKI